MAKELKDPTKQPGYVAYNVVRKDGTKIRVSSRLPTQEELEGADFNMSSAFNQGVMHGLPTRAFLIRKLRKNGVWDDEAEAELTQLRSELEDLLDVVRQNKGKFPTPQAESEFEVKRIELFTKINTLNAAFSGLLAHTADTKADSSYESYLIASVTEYADGPNAGERLYDSVEGFEQDTDTDLGSRVSYEFNCVQRGLPSEYIAAEEREAEELAKSEKEAAAAKLDQPAKAVEVAPTEVSTPEVLNAAIEAKADEPVAEVEVETPEEPKGDEDNGDGPLVLR